MTWYPDPPAIQAMLHVYVYTLQRSSLGCHVYSDYTDIKKLPAPSKKKRVFLEHFVRCISGLKNVIAERRGGGAPLNEDMCMVVSRLCPLIRSRNTLYAVLLNQNLVISCRQ